MNVGEEGDRVGEGVIDLRLSRSSIGTTRRATI